MRRIEAVQAVLEHLGDTLVVSTTGMISRECFASRDRPQNFYVIGSMGLVSSIGLGLALTRPDRRIAVLDGDGSALMAMGTLAMVGERAPANLLHVVFDNHAYASTGGQRSISDAVRLDRVAAAAGYRAERVGNPDELHARLEEMAGAPGPLFLLIEVSAGNEPGIPRVSHAPESIARRFRRAIG